LVRVVVGRALTLEDIVDLEDEALAETGNIILNSWVATLANLLKRGLKMSLPVVVRGDGRHIFETAGQQQSNLVLFLHIRCEISKKEIRDETIRSLFGHARARCRGRAQQSGQSIQQPCSDRRVD
jgi:chemotaxis protein CheC